MKATALDRVLQTAHANRETMPLYEKLYAALIETKPKAFMWFDWDGDISSGYALPGTPIEWPEGAMCLTAPNGIIAGTHMLSILRLPHDDTLTAFLQDGDWSLTGVLIFSPSPTTFDVIGLVDRPDTDVVFPEAQLHFELVDGKWTWSYANTGPVNGFFYNYFLPEDADVAQADIQHPIDYLGSIYAQFLGAWLREISFVGEWKTLAPTPPRVKIKNGRVKKILRAPLLGYSVYKPERYSAG